MTIDLTLSAVDRWLSARARANAAAAVEEGHLRRRLRVLEESELVLLGVDAPEIAPDLIA